MDHKLLDYEQEFLNGYALFKATLSSMKECQMHPEARKRELNKCTRLLSSADTALRQLELEARIKGGSDEWGADYKSLQSRTENYRRELQQAFQELREARIITERLLLLEASEHLSLKNPSTLQRQRLLNTADKAQKGLQTLESSRVLALETEVLGSTVITELQSQRQTIQQTISRVTTVREGLHEASATLQRIVRATFRTKMVAYAVVVLVILALAYISIRKFVPSSTLRSVAAPAPSAAQPKVAPRDDVRRETKPLFTASKDKVSRSFSDASKNIEKQIDKPSTSSLQNVQKAEGFPDGKPSSGS